MFFFFTKHTRSTAMNHEAPRKIYSRVASSSKIWPEKGQVSLWGRRGSPWAGCSHQSCSYRLQDRRQRLCPGKCLFLLRSNITVHTHLLRNEFMFSCNRKIWMQSGITAVCCLSYSRLKAHSNGSAWISLNNEQRNICNIKCALFMCF